ncbi:MAG: hypothetical protein K2O67_00625, partial [Clostridia bacterium]|nr:hypothetical protein [Clostridia bacterium]
MDKEIIESGLTPSDDEMFKDNTPFYRLASPYSAKIEAQRGKVSGFLLFAIIWTVGLIGITVANLATGEEIEIPAIIIISVFACFAAGFLTFGIINQKRIMYANKEESLFLKNCICTDGRIDKYSCVSRRSGSGKNEHRWYEVLITYSFTNLSRKTVTDTLKATYAYDPEFYKGQYLMIAFNDEKSYILSKFTFKKEDEKEFLKNEAARSNDDFEGLDGKLLKCNPKEKFKSAELPHMWFWAAFAVAVFMLAYTIPISILVVPQLLSVDVVPAVIGTIAVYILPALLLAAIIYMLR